MRLLLWAMFNQWKPLQMYLHILKATTITDRRERLLNMLAQFSNQELRQLHD